MLIRLITEKIPYLCGLFSTVRKFILSAILLLSFLPWGHVLAQKEGAIWYFGENAGLDFNRHFPEPLTDGEISTREGVATICDSTGRLLFYTDGMTVWNRNHEPMSNGTGLHGHTSATQSSIVVPRPGSSDPTQYYIFTVDEVGTSDNPGKGLKYSIVDMLRNVRLGDVVQKNVPLLANSTEKITAVKHRDNESYWIIAHGWEDNLFHVFSLTSSTITLEKSIAAGAVHRNTEPGDIHNFGATGYLKSSPRGDLLAVAIGALNCFELFTFDNSTGDIAFLANLPAGDAARPNEPLFMAYGVEFSPTSNYFYGSTRRGGMIYQWSLEQQDQESIRNRVKILRSDESNICGAMQLAFNGKIYVTISGKQYLGVIQSPIQADCNYQEKGASLINNETGVGGRGYFGLPTFLPDFFKAAEFYYENICYRDETIFYLSTRTYVSEPPEWAIYDSTGNILLDHARVDDEWVGHYTFPEPGNYIVQMKVFQGGDTFHRREITIHPLPEPNFEDITPMCMGSHVTLDAGYGAFYRWQDNPNLSLERYRTVSQPGKYYVEIQHYNGCVNRDSTEVVSTPLPEVEEILVDNAVCGEKNGSIQILMKGDESDYEYYWTGYPDSLSNTLSELYGGVYEVEIVSIETDCAITKKISVSEEGAPEVTITPSIDGPVCPGTKVVLTASGTEFFEWQDTTAITDPKITVAPVVTTTYSVRGYSVDINGNPCSNYGTYTVEVHQVQKPELGPPRIGCEGDMFQIFGGDQYTSWEWSTNENTSFIEVSTSINELILNVIDQNGCPSSDTTQVVINPVPEVNLGIDRIVCKGETVELDAGEGDSYEWIINSDEMMSAWDERILPVTATGNFSVKVKKLNCVGISEDVNIRVNDPDKLIFREIITKDISCNGNHDGSIQIIPEGEGAFYEYSIDGGQVFLDNQGLFEGLGGGEGYQLVIREDSACVKAYPDEVRLHEPEVLEAGYQTVPPSCGECTDGEIILDIRGGTEPYDVLWTTSDTTSRLRYLSPGIYLFRINDGNGCNTNGMIHLEAGEEMILIPTAFAPESNNINSRWEIKLLNNKPLSQVFVYDRSGRILWESATGYPEPWDGRDLSGGVVPQGTYFYLIRVEPGLKPMTGTVTIIR